MAFLKSLFGGGIPLGVDIGTNSIKIAEVVPQGETFRLKNYGMLESFGYLERSNEAIQTSTLKLSEDNAAGYLKLLLSRARINGREAVASIPSFIAFSTLLEVPPMSDHEISKFMELQGKQYIPLPLSQVAFEWQKVGERKEENGSVKYQIFVVSVPNEQLEKYQKIFSVAGLKLAAVEIEGTSLARTLTSGTPNPVLIVDIGSRSTSFSVAANGFLKLSSQTDFSGGSLTQTIAQGLSISQRRAEDLKRQRGLLGFGGTEELSTLIQPILDVIISEAKRAIENYEANYQEKIGRVLLAGGGATMAGLPEYWAKQTGLPVEKANPFGRVTLPPALDPIGGELGSLLAVAIGLATKQL